MVEYSQVRKIVEEFYIEILPKISTMPQFEKISNEWLLKIKSLYNNISVYEQARITVIEAKFKLSTKLNLYPIQPDDYLLVMKGGGVKGIAYVGALEVLREYQKHFEFNWFAGTSAGAITAALLASNHSVDELKKILLNKSFVDFLDNKKAIIQTFYKNSGLFEAHSFVEWMNTLLAKKYDSPVEVRLNKLDHRLTVYASTRNKSALEFDSNEEKSKEVNVAFAVRCSMSIPLIFTPQNYEGSKVYDGGLQNNFPLKKLLNKSPNAKF